MKTIAVDVRKCTGCRLCELVCSLRHVKEFNPAAARVQVIGFDERFCLPVMCFHCEHPFCMEICPAGAITKDEARIVRVNRDKCVGCKMCTLACPFGNIVFSEREKAAIKCELCDGQPECVLFCPTAALQLKTVDTAMMHKKAALADKIRQFYQGASFNTGR